MTNKWQHGSVVSLSDLKNMLVDYMASFNSKLLQLGIKDPVVALSKTLYRHCSVLVGPKNRFECGIINNIASTKIKRLHL